MPQPDEITLHVSTPAGPFHGAFPKTTKVSAVIAAIVEGSNYTSVSWRRRTGSELPCRYPRSPDQNSCWNAVDRMRLTTLSLVLSIR